MKMLTGLLAVALLSISVAAFADMGMGGTGMTSAMGPQSNSQMMDMMNNAHTRSEIMDQIAGSAQMRQEMLQKMMHDPEARSAMMDQVGCGQMAGHESQSGMHDHMKQTGMH